MKQVQSPQPLVESIDPRTLTADEVLATAGGPQVTNDGIGLLSPEEIATVAGGPQITNDAPG